MCPRLVEILFKSVQVVYTPAPLKAIIPLAAGVGMNISQATPPPGTFTQVSAGNIHTCGIKSDGTFTCWGSNSYGQSTPYPKLFLPLVFKP